MSRNTYVTEAEINKMQQLKMMGVTNDLIAQIMMRSLSTIEKYLGKDNTISMEDKKREARVNFAKVMDMFYVQNKTLKEIATIMSDKYKENTIKAMIFGYVRPYDEWCSEYKKENNLIEKNEQLSLSPDEFKVKIQKGAFNDVIIQQKVDGNIQEIYLSANDVKKILSLYIDEENNNYED